MFAVDVYGEASSSTAQDMVVLAKQLDSNPGSHPMRVAQLAQELLPVGQKDPIRGARVLQRQVVYPDGTWAG